MSQNHDKPFHRGNPRTGWLVSGGAGISALHLVGFLTASLTSMAQTPSSSPVQPTIRAAAPPASGVTNLSLGPAPLTSEALAWDSVSREHLAKVGDTNAVIRVSVTNISSRDVTIRVIRASCGCTIAKMPQQPWILTPGTNGQFEVAFDLRGKFGVLSKFLAVDTSEGYKLLRFKIVIPETQGAKAMDTRQRNVLTALGDRQAVFKGDCARCHVDPVRGKTGAALYEAACVICHEPEQRATMVPDLRNPKLPQTRGYWKKWIATGRAGTLMPAFALEEGGPLTEGQIMSLVNYMVTDFPKSKPPASGQLAPESVGRAPGEKPVPPRSPAPAK